MIYSLLRHAEDGFVTVERDVQKIAEKPLTNLKQYGILFFAVTKRRQA